MCLKIKVNRDLILTRFNKLDQLLENLRELKEITKEEFLSNYKNSISYRTT